jgi:SAM-dependent methyltransferase
MTEALYDSADAPDGGVRVHNSGSVRLISLYRKRAKRYDRIALLYYFAGFRHWVYRKRAIQSLALNHGDTVVDLGCGTEPNFSLLQEQVGPRGRIKGVDLTDAMLDEAIRTHRRPRLVKRRTDQERRRRLCFPSAVDRILSTFALTLVPSLMRWYGVPLLAQLRRSSLNPATLGAIEAIGSGRRLS